MKNADQPLDERFLSLLPYTICKNYEGLKYFLVEILKTFLPHSSTVSDAL